MTKFTEEELRHIFQSPFNQEAWKSIVVNLFHADKVRRTMERFTDDDENEVGYYLGYAETPDAYRIGLFYYEIKSGSVAHKKVGLRNLVKRFINPDWGEFDAAIVVFDSNPEWRLSLVCDIKELSTAPKRFTFVFGEPDNRYRTPIERFEKLQKQDATFENIRKAFSVEALGDVFFNGYRELYADFIQFITGKRFVKEKGKWIEKQLGTPDSQYESTFGGNDKLVRDYIKKMFGRIVFLYFLQRKGWLNGNRNYMHDLFANSDKKDNFLDGVLEPLFFNVLNEKPENRLESARFLPGIDNIPYLNGGLFARDEIDERTCVFPESYFARLFNFLDSYNFTIDENDTDDAEIGIDPEMLGRIFENLLEDNKDKGAFYTPKEIVSYMFRESIIEYLKTHTSRALHSDIEALINKGLVNHALQNRENARTVHKLLKEVTVCDPAIGSGAFPMGILNILYAARQHLYGFLNESYSFNPPEVKKSIIRDNIYGVDIEKGAVDIARLRFWLAILVDEQVPTPLPNLDYRIVQGNSLITTFNDEYIKLPENPDGRTKNAKLKKELHQLQNDLFNLNGDEKLKCEIDIKCKILEIIKVQLGIDKANVREANQITTDIFETKKISKKALKKANQTIAKGEIKHGLLVLNNLTTPLTNDTKPLAVRAQIDIKFFDWEIIFSNIFSDNKNTSGFDIVIGNPPYIKEGRGDHGIFEPVKQSPYYLGKMDIWYMFACQGIDMLKPGGNLCFIATNNWTTSAGAKKLRNKIINETQIIQLCDFCDYMIFDSASIQTMIMQFKKNHTIDDYSFDLRVLLGDTLDDVTKMLAKDTDANARYLTPNIRRNEYRNKFLTFSDADELLAKLNSIKDTFKFDNSEIAQGIVFPQDFLNKKGQKALGHHKIGDGIFGLKKSELDGLNLTEEELTLIKPYYTSEEENDILLSLGQMNYG